ncbi:uncharacterized protein F4807DRAFT_348347 [Annulohypoxylon truncatum]|uniref:uncharacterized protein n=1 Tax=Annulohypoxylon truncatum TaxID=327061 RepID=UPI0020087CC8|nr:uncharacterized protein F4807DRAFT_348347 [Annulohypoxylon truncatum]KAI1212745.1 hypothetical protein F4807DRAFT_348347 [Annulohypoxylon truncatum]
MANTRSRDRAIICAEWIAALHFLHHVPVNPSSNPVTTIQTRSAGYTLPFEKERDLASTLAFLAFRNDDNNHIPAVCVEEGPNAAHINVLLAVNKLEYSSGRQVLEGLKKSFDGIFSLLDQDYVRSACIEIGVFKAIVSMCRARILHRLRLQGRLMQKMSIKGALLIAFDYLRHVESWKIRNSELLPVLSLFIERAREVLRLADSWIKHQRDAELEDLVEGIHRLQKADHLEALIKEIPNNVMSPSLRGSLVNMINKVARYREAARFLYRVGKKIPLTRKMRAVIVSGSETEFTRSTSSQYLPSLDTTFSLVKGLKNHNKDLENICHLLNSGEMNESRRLTPEDASNQFAAQARKTLREAKIHAEIQLLCYCELNIPHNRLPRVVCSSKDACWLCNEFILLYEKMHTPNSHGKIYPGWRLPMLKNADLAERYNMRLQGTLRNSLKTLFTRKKRTVYPDPKESTLLALYLSDSTLSCVDLPLEDEKGKAVQKIVKEVVLRAEELSAREGVLTNGEEAIAEVEEEVKELEEVEVVKEVTDIERVEKVEDVEGKEKTSDSVEELDQMGDIYEAMDIWISKLEKEAEGLQESKSVKETKEVGEEVGEEVKEEMGGVQNSGEAEDTVPRTPVDHGECSHDIHNLSERWSSGCSSSSSEGSLTLESGKARSKKIWMGKSTPLYNAGPLLNIQIKYAKGVNAGTSNNLHKKLSYSLERLRPEDVEELRNRGIIPIFGAELPGRWVDSNTDEEGCIYISNGDAVMRLFLRPILG